MRRRFLLLMLPFGMYAQLQALVISGSDLLGNVVAEHLDAFAEQSELTLEYDFQGSIMALESLKNGDSDVILYTNGNDEIPEAGYRSIPVGFQTVCVGVHENNPLDSINFSQLKEVFRANGRIESWAGLMDDPTWQARQITLAAYNGRDSMTIALFNHRVLDREDMRVTIEYSSNVQALVDFLRKDNNGMALLPSSKEFPEIRYLPVLDEGSGQAYSPSPENIMFGDYALRLPFYVVCREDAMNAEVKAFIEFLLSDEVANSLRESHFTPLPESDRISYRQGLD